MKKTIFLRVQKLFYNAMYSESVPDRYSDGYAAMERVGDIIYRCENDDINTGHSSNVLFDMLILTITYYIVSNNMYLFQ